MMGMLQGHLSHVPGVERRKHTVTTKFLQWDRAMNFREGN